MSIDENSTNALFLAFRFQGPTLALIVPAVFTNLIAISGMIMNSFVIYTTAKTSSLRGSANFLMALICFFEVVHQSNHLVFLGVVISGTNFISRWTATLLILPMLFGINANMLTVFCVAFDRLFAVAFTKIHESIYFSYKRIYLACHILLCTIYSIFCCRMIVNFAANHRGDPTTGCICEIILVTNSEIGTTIFLLMVVPNSCAAICYALIGLLIRCNKTVAHATHTRLLRSLVIILAVSIGSYVFSLSVYQVILNVDFGLNPISLWQWSFLAGAFLNIGAAAHCPILYINSVEYRNAFRSQLGRLFKSIKVGPLSASVPQGNSISHPRKSVVNQQQNDRGGGRRLSNVERV